MASQPGSPSSPERLGGGGGGVRAAGGGPAGPPLLPFKLRFAAEREPGRSNVSLVKPLGLPAVVAEKFYTQPSCREKVNNELEEAALRRVIDAYRCGPREKYTHPHLTSHEVGWWVEYARVDPPVLRYHIRNSWWLREREHLLSPHPRHYPPRTAPPNTNR